MDKLCPELSTVILIGIGANLPSMVGSPVQTCEAALGALAETNIRVVRRSPWYRSAPVPASTQPWYVNGVAVLETALGAEDLLGELNRIERRFGRRRERKNGSRTIDLDLLAYDDLVFDEDIKIPHPRMAERAFVLVPLCDVAAHWRHPVSGLSATEMLAHLEQTDQVMLQKLQEGAKTS